VRSLHSYRRSDFSLLNPKIPHFTGVLLSSWQDALDLLDHRDDGLHRHLQALPINVGASSIDDVKGKAEGGRGRVAGVPMCDIQRVVEG